ncbi:MAG: polysaccharide biosynthesis protein [Ruminococcus sp.]|nr:polysaccharide biosynthesis protein [Ruminococcus sp.]
MSSVRNNRRREKKDDFLMQGMILAVAMVLTKVIGVVYRIPLTNILGDEGIGFYGYAFEVYAMALMLSSLSLPTAVSKLVASRMAMRQRRNAFRVFQCAFVFSATVGILTTLLIFFGAESISVNLMKSPLSVYALRVLAVGLFIVAILGVLRGYFQGLGTMMPTAVSQIMEQIVNAAVSLIGAGILFRIGTNLAEEKEEELLGAAYGAAGGTLGTVAGAVAALFFLVFSFLAYRGVIRRQIRMDRSSKRESYGRILRILLLTILPVIFSTAIYNINQILDLTIFNGIMSAQGYTEKEYMALQGIYTGKYNVLINVPLAVANGLASSVIPSLTAAVAKRDKGQIHEKIEQTIRLTMVIAIPCFVGFTVLASPLMVLLFNDDSATPATLLLFGAVTVILYSYSTISNSILQGLDEISTPARNAGISLIVHLVALFLMLVLLKWNIYALVGSNIVFSLCMSILNARAIRKTCGYRQELDRTFIKPLTAAVIMGIVIYVLHLVLDLLFSGRFLATTVSVLVAVVVYGIAALKLGVLLKSDFKTLPQGEKIYRFCRRHHLLPARQVF